MEISFDNRGNLFPHNKNTITSEQFKKFFVDAFDSSSTRRTIYDNYLNYCKEFKSQISPNFIQWVNGSFVTNKLNPNDIDLVTIIDHTIAKEKYELLRSNFINRESLKEFKIDAYLVRTYTKDHIEYSKTVSDLLYWDHWFSKTKKNRAKKRFDKGFVEIVFNL